jgi:hypothetical protein
MATLISKDGLTMSNVGASEFPASTAVETDFQAWLG